MYLPTQFEERRPAILAAFIRSHPLGTTVVQDDGELSADPLPWLLRPEPVPCGTLVAHVARANPLARRAAAGVPCLVLFHGPHHYISPSWYASKALDARVVPTWNYQVVQARGILRSIEDPGWLDTLLEELTAVHEQGQPHPWTPADAPADHIQRLRQAIVGLELRIDSLVGKFKLSQNQSEANRVSVLENLVRLGTPEALAMAEAMRVNGG